MSKKDEMDEIKDAMKAKPTLKFGPEDLLSTGSTLLNLACSGNQRGGFGKGKYYLLVGDSESGKTFLSLTCLAEASINTYFDDYRFIYDNAEDGALMDVSHFFGEEVSRRLEPPALDDDGDPVFSDTVERFYYHLDDAFAEEKPFIYILDSMDALETDDDDEHFQKSKKADASGKDKPGSYGMAKAKLNSMYLRRAVSKLKKNGSILIIISQTRDNVEQFSFEKKTRAGGKSLRFYAALEIWSSIKEELKKTVRGKQRQLGLTAQVKVKKNRHTGKRRTVNINIYHSVGIDDIGSCIDFLMEENHWKGTPGKMTAREFSFSGSKEDLVKQIEETDMEEKLRRIVAAVWSDIEDSCSVERKSRYS